MCKNTPPKKAAGAGKNFTLFFCVILHFNFKCVFTKENNAKPKHKSSIQSGDVQKLNLYFMEGQNTDGVWKDAEKLVEFIWFSLCFHFARRLREGWRELTRQSFEIKTDDTGAKATTKNINFASTRHWYRNEPMGKNTISKMTERISIKAELSERYANQCIRASTVSHFFVPAPAV